MATTEGQTQSLVSAELSQLHARIDDQNRLQEDLINKLCPVLSSSVPSKAKEKPDEPKCSCEVGAEIQNARQKVENLIAITNDCFQRISV